jgi:uncharacterized membrane protein (UPF0127 family)
VKNIILPLLGTIVFIIALGLYTQKKGINMPITVKTPTPTKKAESKEIAIAGKRIFVTVVQTESERKKGLAGKLSLAQNEGMLFVFDQKNVYPSFWMKDTLIPLDIIWIKGNKITKIEKNVQPPAPGTLDSQLKLYYPDKPIDYVLEVNAGFSDLNNVKVGDSVDFSEI